MVQWRYVRLVQTKDTNNTLYRVERVDKEYQLRMVPVLQVRTSHSKNINIMLYYVRATSRSN